MKTLSNCAILTEILLDRAIALYFVGDAETFDKRDIPVNFIGGSYGRPQYYSHG